MRPSLFCLFFLPSLASGAGVLDTEIQTALEDVKKLSPESAYQTRYVTIYPIVPKDKRNDYLKVSQFHLNSLSREADLVYLRRVSDTVWALELDNYGWKAETWEKLLDIEPYFHVRVKVLQGQESPKVYYRGGGEYKANWYKQIQLKEVILTTLAPWVDPIPAQSLSLYTNSAIPIVRLDWFINQTGDSADRKAGYYDWIGIKNLKDAQTLAGFDLKLSQAARKEIAAIVTESGVGLNNRQIFRFGTVGGSWWETRDTLKSTDTSNAARNLDGDFKFDASEIYFTLPNGLFGFVLADNKGALQESVPDKIAPDHVSTNNDRRIRAGISCIRCHVEGLRPIDDWARKVFRAENQIGLGSPDREKARRLKQLYLGPLQRELTADRAKYTEVLKELTGMKPDELAKSYAAYWAKYESGPIFPDDAERELGIPKDQFVAKMKSWFQSQKVIDPLLASLISEPAVNLRREHFEEMIPSIMQIMGSVK